MRRYIFYLGVALAAFGIGLSVAFNFYWKSQDDFSKVELIDASKPEVVNNSLEHRKSKQPEIIKIELKKLPCKDKILQIVWNGITNEIASINTEYANKIKDCSDIIEIHFESADLNNDGQNEVFIRGVESPFRCGNNCSTYWIFQQIGEKDYKKLFESKGYLPVVRNQKTKGYKDIMFVVYASYIYSDQKLIKFNGTQYVPKKCWSESKLYKNKNGELVEGKSYKTEYHECKETE